MQKLLLVLLACCVVARSQFLVPAPAFGLPFQIAADQPRRPLQHRAVVLNAEAESRLPPSLQNPFYKNPNIAAALAKESWLTSEEMPVFDREAEKIPREKIFSLIKNAGLSRRR